MKRCHATGCVVMKLCALFSAHNWNTLFVGANAVADIMAEKYGKSKDEILTKV